MSNRGFTLVEVLVALVVLAVGLLALANMNIVTVRANSQTHQASEGVMLAQDKMEELRQYALMDQPGNFSIFDFDYLISTNPAFTSVEDPPGSGTSVAVPGLLSGSNGGTVTTTTGATYFVLYDDGTHGDAAAGDGVYSDSDTVYTASQARIGTSGYTVSRTWSVEPVSVTTNRTDFARLTVDASWTDQRIGTRSVHLESLAHRRQ